jgi:hypothetical protein
MILTKADNVVTIANIDWQLLSEQKQWLLQQTGDEVEGLIHLLDALEESKADVH